MLKGVPRISPRPRLPGGAFRIAACVRACPLLALLIITCYTILIMKDTLKCFSHPLKPVFDQNSRVLILGTFPSVKSRETMFYYGNPHNRFYKVLASLLKEEVPEDNVQKKEFLLRGKIAVFDVLRSCEIRGSADTSIKNPVPNDFSEIFRTADIRQVFANGKKAQELYEKYCLKETGRPSICLPSTSPANASASFERLSEQWAVILNYLR